MSWFYVGNDDVPTIFWASSTTGTKSNIVIKRYSVATLAFEEEFTFNAWAPINSGNQYDAVVPVVQGQGDSWIMIPHTSYSNTTFASWKPWISLNNGKTWAQVSSPFTTDLNVTRIKTTVVVDGSNNPVFFISGRATRSVSGGANYENQNFVSKDKGVTWQALYAKNNDYQIHGSGKNSIVLNATGGYSAVLPGFGQSGNYPSTTLFRSADLGLNHELCDAQGAAQNIIHNLVTTDNALTAANVHVRTNTSVKGDLDPIAQTFRAFSNNPVYQTVYLGQGKWLSNRTDSVDDVRVSIDGGNNWDSNSSGNFSGRVYTQKNFIRVY